MKRWLQLAACIFLFTSCNNSANSDSKSGKTYSDTLMDEVMEDHNIGMAKMSKINETKNKIQHVLDSISTLPTNTQRSLAQYKMQLDSSFNRLTFAGYAMEKWMEEFNMDSAKDNEEKRIEYLKSEKIKISKVKEAMLSSLKTSDSLLKK